MLKKIITYLKVNKAEIIFFAFIAFCILTIAAICCVAVYDQYVITTL